MTQDHQERDTERPASLIQRLRRQWPGLLVAALGLLAIGEAYGVSFGALLAAFVAIGTAILATPLPAPVPPRADEGPAEPLVQVEPPVPASSVIESFPDPVAVIDRSGLVDTVNEEFRSAFGNLPERGSFLLRFRAPEIQEAIHAVLSGQSVAPVEYQERAPLERWFRVSITPIAPAAASSPRFIVHFRDLSESRRIDRMRADFVANASHELRTPLAALSGFLETLAGPARDDPAARERFIAIMQEQASRMSRLIDDLLSLSRLEMRMSKAGFALVDLELVVRETADALHAMARERGVEMAIVSSATKTSVRGVRDELIQVVENLAENALKYASEGGRVDLSIRNVDLSGLPAVALEVKDYGPGIPEEHIPRLTERFYRVSVEASRSRRGTGLGLAIVKHIVSRHDGRLFIASKVGQGSAFTVTFPAAQGEKPRLEENNRTKTYS